MRKERNGVEVGSEPKSAEAKTLDELFVRAGIDIELLQTVVPLNINACDQAFAENDGLKWYERHLLRIKVADALKAAENRQGAGPSVPSLQSYLDASIREEKYNITLAIIKLFIDAQFISEAKNRDEFKLNIGDENLGKVNLIWLLGIIGNDEIRNEIIKTLLSFYLETYRVNMIHSIVSSEKFQWSSQVDFIQTIIRVMHSEKDPKLVAIVKSIFEYLLEAFPAEEKNDALFRMFDGHTRLTFSIVFNRKEARQLMMMHGNTFDAGIFQVGAQGRSPMAWAKQQRDVALQSCLLECYEKHIAQIADLLLSSDPRVCQTMPGQKACNLETTLVNDWLGLKDTLFNELKARVEVKTTSCDELRQIYVALINPKSPLCQFFNIGHGGVLQSASPWPAKFTSLLHKIEDTLSEANRVLGYSSSDEV